VWELLDASLPPKDALPTLSSDYLVCELYVTYCMTMSSHVWSKEHHTGHGGHHTSHLKTGSTDFHRLNRTPAALALEEARGTHAPGPGQRKPRTPPTDASHAARRVGGGRRPAAHAAAAPASVAALAASRRRATRGTLGRCQAAVSSPRCARCPRSNPRRASSRMPHATRGILPARGCAQRLRSEGWSHITDA